MSDWLEPAIKRRRRPGGLRLRSTDIQNSIWTNTTSISFSIGNTPTLYTQESFEIYTKSMSGYEPGNLGRNSHIPAVCDAFLEQQHKPELELTA